MNFYMEIAKLRAARKVWSQLIKEKFSPKDERHSNNPPLRSCASCR
jgi:methylmalonyl-CoA mutase N-terminal domain/subunit